MDATEFWEKLETEGESTVRRRLAEGVYGAQKKSLVEEWLRKKDLERDIDRHEDLFVVAKSAKHAAWVASIAACISAIAALIAIFIAN